jgi:uncharacterized protein YdaU (DUF1376 family)
MHYYQFNIGDYRAATAHLSNEEDLAYRRLLDMYYDTEKQIPLETQWVAKRLRLDAKVVEAVLQDMFKLTETGWHHGRCETVIEQYHAMAEKNRANGRLGGRKKNPVASDSKPIAKATINDKPITNNHSIEAPQLKKERTKGSRLSADWVLPKEWEDWAKQERPDLNLRSVGEQFRDYWSAKAGSGATKLDWQATWRNWVRNQRQERFNPADIAKVTVPSRMERDPALVKLDEDRKNTAPPNPEILAKLKLLRGVN